MRGGIGARSWAIADGYLPGASTGPNPKMESHGTVCILNAGERDANVQIMVYFSDRDPVGPYELTVAACRTRHFRFNELKSPRPIPKDTDFACVIRSDQPVIVQHTRLDSRQSENALMTTMAYAADPA